MNPILKACLLALPLLSTGPALAQEPPFDTGMIPAPVTLLPDDDAKALVVLLSDGAGWQAGDQAEAERLQGNGAIVIGIDTPKYLTSLATDQGDCIYMVSDIEALSHQLQRKAGNAAFLPPIIAGRGEGGALALPRPPRPRSARHWRSTRRPASRWQSSCARQPKRPRPATACNMP